MEIKSNGGADFAALGRRFRAAGKGGAAIRKTLTARIQAELKKITAEQKAMAAGMKVKGAGGGGTSRREMYAASKSSRRRRDGYGLRAATARTIKSRVAYSGRKLGAAIYTDVSGLPQSQRRLPRYLNAKKGWRHPVWGNRQIWVRQVGEPYFDTPIDRHRTRVRKAVEQAVTEVMREL